MTLKAPRRDGWDNLDIFAKLPSYYSLEHEFLISFALQVQLPVDNHAVVERNPTSLGPICLLEKGMGDVPN